MKVTYKLIMYLAGICTSIIPLIIGFFMRAFEIPIYYQLVGILFSGLMNSIMLGILIKPKV